MGTDALVELLNNPLAITAALATAGGIILGLAAGLLRGHRKLERYREAFAEERNQLQASLGSNVVGLQLPWGRG